MVTGQKRNRIMKAERQIELRNAKRGYPLSAIRYLLLVALSGCVAAPPEPDYSATWPEPTPSASAGNGSIYQAGHDIALFENSVARRVGDTLIIRLNENTNASKSSSTSTKKSTSASLPGPTVAGRPVTVNGVEVLEKKIAAVYDLYGKPENFRSVLYKNTGHEYLPEMREEMLHWFQRTLPVMQSHPKLQSPRS